MIQASAVGIMQETSKTKLKVIYATSVCLLVSQ